MIRRICVASVTLILLSSCHSLNKYSEKVQNFKMKDIEDKWVYIDTSKMLFAKMDLKKGGYCSISVGYGKEIARFLIAETSFDKGYIRLKLIDTEESIKEEFIGPYDFFADSLDLKLGSIENQFVFIRATKLNLQLIELEKSLIGEKRTGVKLE